MPILRVEKREVKLGRRIEMISPTEFKRGLANPPIFPWLRASIRSAEILPEVTSRVPIDCREVVEWMQIATAEYAILDGTCEDYNRLGSSLFSNSGDAYSPGVSAGNLRGLSAKGSTVRSQGYGTVVTPKGNFNVPVGGKATGIFSDILGWGAVNHAAPVQWTLSLLQWKELASTPIDNRVRFANLNSLVAPQFFTVGSSFPAPVNIMSLGFTSGKDQKIAMSMRDTGDYTQVISSDELEIPAGESSMDYFILGFPFVENFVLHLQPEDNTETVLDSLTVTP